MREKKRNKLESDATETGESPTHSPSLKYPLSVLENLLEYLTKSLLRVSRVSRACAEDTSEEASDAESRSFLMALATSLQNRYP